MAVAGAQLVLTSWQPGGQWELPCVPWTEGWVWGGSGCWVCLSPVLAHMVWALQQGRAQDRGALPGGQPGVCPTPSMAVDGAGCSEVQLPGLTSVFIFQAERKLVLPKPSVFSQTSHSLAEETHVSRSPLSPLSYGFESERIGCRFQGMFRQRLFEQHLCK